MKLREFVETLRDCEMENDLFNPEIFFSTSEGKYTSAYFVKTKNNEIKIVLDDDNW